MHAFYTWLQRTDDADDDEEDADKGTEVSAQ